MKGSSRLRTSEARSSRTRPRLHGIPSGSGTWGISWLSSFTQAIRPRPARGVTLPCSVEILAANPAWSVHAERHGYGACNPSGREYQHVAFHLIATQPTDSEDRNINQPGLQEVVHCDAFRDPSGGAREGFVSRQELFMCSAAFDAPTVPSLPLLPFLRQLLEGAKPRIIAAKTGVISVKHGVSVHHGLGAG